MRYLLSLCLLLSFIATAFTQTTGKYGITAGLTYNYRTYFQGDALVKELPAVNYHFGLRYLQPLSEKVSVVAGLGFRTIGYPSERKTGLLWASDLPASFGGTGMFDPSLPHELQIFRQYRFLEVPVNLRFHAKDGAASRYWQVGVANMIYLNDRIRVKTDLSKGTTTVDRNSFVRNLHTVLQVEMGWQWSLKDSPLQLSLAPSLQFHVTPLNKDGSIYEHPYSGGLSLGFWW